MYHPVRWILTKPDHERILETQCEKWSLYPGVPEYQTIKAQIVCEYHPPGLPSPT